MMASKKWAWSAYVKFSQKVWQHCIGGIGYILEEFNRDFVMEHSVWGYKNTQVIRTIKRLSSLRSSVEKTLYINTVSGLP